MTTRSRYDRLSDLAPEHRHAPPLAELRDREQYWRAERDAAMDDHEHLESLRSQHGTLTARQRDELRQADRRVADATTELDYLLARIEDETTGRAGLAADPVATDGIPDMRAAELDRRALEPAERMTDWIAARRRAGRAAGEHDDAPADLDAGKLLRGWMLGRWDGADLERRWMGEAPDSSGGYVLPTAVSAQLIDKARAKTRVIEAGAKTLPFTTPTLRIPRWDGDPTPTWRAEHDALNESDALLGALSLNPRTLGVVVRVSRELAEDAPELVDVKLVEELTKVFALELDRAALYGDGMAEPPGVASNAGITTLSITGGPLPQNWSAIVDGMSAVAQANHEPGAALLPPTVEYTLAKLEDSTGQPIAPPSVVTERLRRLSTTQVAATEVFVADWSELTIGMRTNITVTPLRERYADQGQVGLVGWMRADVALDHADAFCRITDWG